MSFKNPDIPTPDATTNRQEFSLNLLNCMGGEQNINGDVNNTNEKPKVTETFHANGQVESRVTSYNNGMKIEENFNAGGILELRLTTHNNGNGVSLEERFRPDGSLESTDLNEPAVGNTPARRKLTHYGMEGSRSESITVNGQSETKLFRPDGTVELTKLVSPNGNLKYSRFTPDGKPQSIETLDPNGLTFRARYEQGRLQEQLVRNQNGSYTRTTFNAAGNVDTVKNNVQP